MLKVITFFRSLSPTQLEFKDMTYEIEDMRYKMHSIAQCEYFNQCEKFSILFLNEIKESYSGI